MSWVDDNIERAKRIAATREGLHLKHASHRPLSKDYEIIGVLGEIKFEQITGYPVDENGYLQGDEGKDFHTPAGFVDVKTAQKAINLIIEVGKVYDYIYVLASYNDTDVELLGWEYGRVMLEMPTRDFGYGVINHHKHNSRLRLMREFYEMCGLKIKEDTQKVVLPTCNTCLHYWFKKLRWHCFLKDEPIKDLFTQRCSKYVDRFEKTL